MIDWALGRARLVFGICLATVAIAVALVMLGAVGFEFMSSVDRGEVFVQGNVPDRHAAGRDERRRAEAERRDLRGRRTRKP